MKAISAALAQSTQRREQLQVLALQLLALLETALGGRHPATPSRYFECATSALCTLTPGCAAPRRNSASASRQLLAAA